MKRDCRINIKRPWGIYFTYDLSGGAYCVASISLCSPAETAVDLGSRQNTKNTDWSLNSCIFNTSNTASNIIQIGDIILYANGMNTGGMTENKLYHYIDNICESQIIIALARQVLNITIHMQEMVSSKIVTNSDDDDEDSQ